MKKNWDSITYLNCTNFIKLGGSICSTSSLKVLQPRCLSGRAHLPSKRLLFGCFHPCSKEDLSLNRTLNWWTNKPPNRTLLKLACRRTSSTCAPQWHWQKRLLQSSKEWEKHGKKQCQRGSAQYGNRIVLWLISWSGPKVLQRNYATALPCLDSSEGCGQHLYCFGSYSKSMYSCFCVVILSKNAKVPPNWCCCGRTDPWLFHISRVIRHEYTITHNDSI